MRMKEKALEHLDRMDETIESAQRSMGKHAVTPKQVYDILTSLKTNVGNLVALINREPDN